jgi:hypothetical protein
MSKPSKMAAYLAEANRLREEVNAFIAAKRDGAATEPLQSTKPERRRSPPAARPTELPGWPLNPSPPAEIPDYGTMVQATKQRQRKIGAQLPSKPIGEPRLIKKGDVRGTAG